MLLGWIPFFFFFCSFHTVSASVLYHVFHVIFQVDVKCEVASSGGPFYPEHLPLLGKL